MSLRLLPILALAVVALAGCGKQGPLDRPGPLFGGPAGVTMQTDGEAPRTVGTIDKRDRDSTNDLPPLASPPPPAAGR